MTTKIPVELSSTPGIVDGSNATAITIDSSENVGIGTSSISSSAGWGTLLEVSGTTNAGIKLTETDTANGDYSLGVTAGTFRIWDETASAFRVTLDGSGNVGIGNASPSTVLEVTGTGDAETGITATHSRSGVGYTLLLNNTNNGANKGSGIKWQSGGFATGAIIARSDATASSGDAPAYMTFHTSADGSEGLDERLRITSAGDFRIGTPNDLSSKVGINDATNQITFTADHVNNSGFDKYVIDSSCSQNGGSYYFYNAQIRGIANKFRVAQDGNVTNTNNSYGAISDQRLKTDIADASSQWDDIKALKVRKFKLGMQPDDGFKIGVVSQELEASGMNGLVQEKDADEYHIVYNPDLKDQKVKEVKYSVLYMKAIKALQEAMTRIETLETKVKTLEDT